MIDKIAAEKVFAYELDSYSFTRSFLILNSNVSSLSLYTISSLSEFNQVNLFWTAPPPLSNTETSLVE